MTHAAFDALNPKFLYYSPLRSAPKDRKELMEQVDHAIIALDGRAPVGGDCCLEQLNPVDDASTVRVELWVNDLDDYTCTYGFLMSSEDGRKPIARGERCVVSVDPASQQPAKWDREFRTLHTELLKDLPAYA